MVSSRERASSSIGQAAFEKVGALCSKSLSRPASAASSAFAEGPQLPTSIEGS